MSNLSPSLSLEAETELIENYVKRWQRLLHLGNWHIHTKVIPASEWTNENSDAYTLMEGLANVAYVFFKFEPDGWKGTDALYWHNNRELIVIHELYHIVFYDYMATLPPKYMTPEERLVNRLSVITYELEHKTDPTKEIENE